MTQIALLLSIFFAMAVLLGGWFLARRVWPYVTAQVEVTRLHRIKEQEQFLSVLGSYAKTTEGTRLLMGQMQEILSLQTDAIQRLADEVSKPPKRRSRAVKLPPKDIL